MVVNELYSPLDTFTSELAHVCTLIVAWDIYTSFHGYSLQVQKSFHQMKSDVEMHNAKNHGIRVFAAR